MTAISGTRTTTQKNAGYALLCVSPEMARIVVTVYPPCGKESNVPEESETVLCSASALTPISK